jgi:hypothetical protein
MWEKRETNTEFWWGNLGKTYFEDQEGGKRITQSWISWKYFFLKGGG